MRFLELQILVAGAGALLYIGSAGPLVEPTCRTTSETLAVGTTTKGMEGEYKLIIVSTEGVAAGRSVEGSLRLWAPPESLQAIRRLDGTPNPSLKVPLIGTAVIDLAQVGGIIESDLTSSDPMAPGVSVHERNAVYQGKPFTEITLHVGSGGHGRNTLSFDGPYNALQVDRIDSTGFIGRWQASLGYTTYKAEGHFCAIRR